MNSGVFNLGKISKNRGEIYGLTIIWIMIMHGVILDGVHFPKALKWLDCILSHGNVGVDIFLFLSGMGLYFSYTQNSKLRDYMSKRLVRVLLPFALIAVPYYILIDLVLYDEKSKFLLNVTQIGFWTKGLHTTWYVPAILLCYFLYPYIYAFLYEATEGRKDQEKAIIVRVVLFCLAWMAMTITFMLASKTNYDHMEVALTRIPIFVVGCAFGKPVCEKKEISGAWTAISVPVIAAIFLILHYVKGYLYIKRYVYIIFAVALIFVFTWFFDKVKAAWLHKVLKWFGNISLELYLVHICYRDYFTKTPYCEEHILIRWAVIILISIVIAAVIGKICQIISRHILVKAGIQKA